LVRLPSLRSPRKNYRLAGQDRLRIELKLPEVRDRVAAVRRAIAGLL
jgi:predicted dithiol-disulfide oxidoreductase (DUF899 family)